MKPTLPASVPSPSTNGGHPLVVAGISLVLGATLTAAWFHFHRPNTSGDDGTANISGTTENILAHLPQPVRIRFYCLLPSNSAGEDLPAFAGRVDQLLAAMQTAGGGNVQVVRLDETAGTNADAAAAAGIQAFNLDKGGACFLGLTVSGGAHSETLPRLFPQWEPALQYDIDRAIEQVMALDAPVVVKTELAKPAPETIKFVQQLIPDVSVISVADADQIFHQQFLNECADAGTELEKQINAAQEQVAKAEESGSATDLEAARQHLQQVQLSQADRLKQIAANLQLRLAAFQQLKAGATNPAN